MKKTVCALENLIREKTCALEKIQKEDGDQEIEGERSRVEI